MFMFHFVLIKPLILNFRQMRIFKPQKWSTLQWFLWVIDKRHIYEFTTPSSSKTNLKINWFCLPELSLAFVSVVDLPCIAQHSSITSLAILYRIRYKVPVHSLDQKRIPSSSCSYEKIKFQNIDGFLYILMD